jgi:sterol desaturase/sphingolipid hydroxylase (fatty acid hydroxylase superfamily)
VWTWLSPLIIVSAALLFVALERVFPHDRGQRIFRDGFWVDLIGYGLVQSYLLGLLIGALIAWLDQQSGLSRLQLVSAWSVPLQLSFFFVTHDLYIYCFHRWQHRSPRLWRIHEAHHSVHDVDWLAGTRSHPLEILINQTIEFAPIALLGAAPEVVLMKATLDAVWGMYIHSNLGVRSGRLQWLINGPEMHRLHHARDVRNRNFATKLAIWDFLFGTAYLPAERKPHRYGLHENDDEFPAGYLAQLGHAFRPLARSQQPEQLPAPVQQQQPAARPATPSTG